MDKMLKKGGEAIKLTETDKKLLQELGGEVRLMDVSLEALKDDADREALLRMIARVTNGEVKKPENEQ